MTPGRKESKKAPATTSGKTAPPKNKSQIRAIGRDSDLLVIRSSLQRLAIIEEYKVGFINEETAKGRILKIKEQISKLGKERGFIEEAKNDE